jgi:hypothetical protein
VVACALAPVAALAIPPLSGSISGMRTLPGGELDALSAPRVYQLQSGTWTMLAPTITSFFDGTYLIPGLTPGTYRVGVLAATSGPIAYPPAFFGGGRTVITGADVFVSSGVTTLGVDIQRDTSETIAADALEPDNSARQARAVTPGSGWVEHTTCGLPDADWIKFDAIAGHTYSIETSGSATYPIWGNIDWALSATHAALFSADGSTQLAEDYDAGGGYSLLRWTATSSGPLYARVVSNSEAYSGTAAYSAYTLRLADDTAIAGTASIAGSVLQSTSGFKSIGGAKLRFTNLDTGDTRYPVTRHDGTYSLSGLTPGQYAASAYALGYNETTTPAPITVAAGESVSLNLYADGLVGSLGSLSGCVQRAEGGAAQGATAVLDAGGPSNEVLVDVDGHFIFSGNVTPGEHTVTISHAGYTTVVRSGIVAGFDSNAVIIETLFPAGTVKGVVRSAGVGLAGVTVSASDATTTTAADGSYVLPGVAAGAADITFGKPTYVSAVLGVSVSQGATSTLDATLVHPKTACAITRSPKQSTLTYKRKKGSAKFTLSATLSGAYGRFGASPVYLQYSSNGKTGWKSFPKQTTNANGVASKAIVVKKKSTKYYRWYTPSTSAHAASYSVKQKVVVK